MTNNHSREQAPDDPIQERRRTYVAHRMWLFDHLPQTVLGFPTSQPEVGSQGRLAPHIVLGVVSLAASHRETFLPDLVWFPGQLVLHILFKQSRARFKTLAWTQITPSRTRMFSRLTCLTRPTSCLPRRYVVSGLSQSTVHHFKYVETPRHLPILSTVPDSRSSASSRTPFTQALPSTRRRRTYSCAPLMTSTFTCTETG